MFDVCCWLDTYYFDVLGPDCTLQKHNSFGDKQGPAMAFFILLSRVSYVLVRTLHQQEKLRANTDLAPVETAANAATGSPGTGPPPLS